MFRGKMTGRRKLNWLLITLLAFTGFSSMVGQVAEGPLADYGDAPDEVSADYEFFASQAEAAFPSTLIDDGLRHYVIHRFPDERVFLGPDVTLERNALVVDEDLDDGWLPIGTKTCTVEEYVIQVTVPEHAKEGPIYVNVLFDWNHDGRWADADICTQGTAFPRTSNDRYKNATPLSLGRLTPEWGIQNLRLDLLPYDLKPGFNGDVTLPPILAGLLEGEMWMRFTISTEPVNEDVFVPVAFGGPGWDGSGDFLFGETEDYFGCLLIDLNRSFPGCPLNSLPLADPAPTNSTPAVSLPGIHTLTLLMAGPGSGSVSGGGTFNVGDAANPSASADAGSVFVGWTGPHAAECAAGSVFMDANKVCIANFFLNSTPPTTSNTHTLTLLTAGTGSGSVSGGGTFNDGDTANPTATPASESTFAGWTGADGTECTTGSVLMDVDKVCIAIFILDPPTHTLTLSTAGTGSGTVSGAGTYNDGITANPVTASADAGSTFVGWTGPHAAECATGSVLMNADKACIANFVIDPPPSPSTHTLTLLTAGTGSGSVNGGGTFDDGSTANPTATAASGSTFTGWTGADGTECTTGSVLMNTDKVCIANFTLDPPTHTLTLSTAGTGSGSVSGGGTFDDGSTANPTATAASGSTFTGWTGLNGSECASGSVIMNADKVCVAVFTLIPTAADTFTLTLLTAGAGSGTVSGGGTFDDGDIASPTATADSGSAFIGWTGTNGTECTTGSVTMDANKVCVAVFILVSDTREDKSSLLFTDSTSSSCTTVSATVKNGGSDMTAQASWVLLFAASGNPKNGTTVTGGSIPLLVSEGEFTLTATVSQAGNYMFQAFQSPGHPGTGTLFSSAISFSPC